MNCVNITWNVHNENCDFVALFLGMNALITNETYNKLQPVSEALDLDKQKKAENENAVPYTDKEKQNWKNRKDIIVYESDKQFEAFVEKVLNNEDTHIYITEIFQF